MGKVPKLLSDYFAEIGRRGGQARVRKGAATLSEEERSHRARKAVLARWAKKRKEDAAASRRKRK